MAQEQARQLLQQGIAAAQAGQADTARQLFRQAARLDPQNETTWMWLTSVAADTNERIFCLKRILEINPQNERALQGLQQLGTQPAATPVFTSESSPGVEAAPAEEEPQGISVPKLDDQKNARLQQAADDFLRRYNPEPINRLQIEWVRKQRGRYAEKGEQRLRRITFAVAGLVIAGLIIGAIILVTQLDISLGTGDKVAIQETRIVSPTPTAEFTPTPGGATATPFPDAMAVPATNIPQNLVQRGNPYSLMEPTDIYPRPNTDVGFIVEDAVRYYSIGDYATAIEKIEKEREQSNHCYPSLMYYLALSLAGQKDYNDATRVLREGLDTEPAGSYRSCQGSALLVAGLGEIAYMQDNQSQAALTFSEQALAQDPLLVQASLTKGRVELARSQYQVAWQTVKNALDEHPEDTNLLLLMARIELASEQPGSALAYVGQALFIEPVLREGLQLQAETYLMLAEQSPAGSAQQTQYYGLAVVSAQTLQLYYEGDPAGYLYLAKARMGEGNLDLAETALTRILAIEDVLPESAEPVIREARLLRGNLYYDQGRFQEAWNDLEPIALTRGTVDQAVAETLVAIAFQSEDYLDAEEWISQLRFVDTRNAAYVLLEAKLRVEVCTFRSELPCRYDDMLENLSDAFIAELENDAQRADAYSYRAQAQYGDTRRSTASEEEQTVLFRLALNDIDQALAIRETAIDHYTRAMILEALGETLQAFEEYQWLVYWGDPYVYPFEGNDFERHVADVANEAEEIIAAQATETPSEPQPTEPPATPRPSPTTTPTPAPEPTAMPVAPIP